METFDYPNQFDSMKKRVTKALSKALDIQADATKLQLRAKEIWVDDNASSSDFESQAEAVRKDQTWGVPVYANVELVDKSTGKVISSATKMRLATLPKPTNFGSFIIKGQHRQVNNQLRRKPGIYVTEKKNGEVKAEINVAGRPFDIEFNAAKGVFRLMRGSGGADTTGVPLYPILQRLGISDSMLAKIWGEEVLAKNKAVSKQKGDIAVIKAAKYFEAGEYSTPEEAANTMRDWFTEAELRPEVTKQTVGKEYKSLSPEAVVDASKALLMTVSGKRKPDDRNALEYKKAVSMSDLFAERLLKPNGEIAPQLNDFRRKISRKLNNQRYRVSDVREVLSASQFTPAVTNFFTTSSVSNVPDQTNPLNMINGMTKVTLLGEGGIANPQLVKGEERAVHPSQLGFIDPIHTPESENVGLTNHLAVGAAKRGEDIVTQVFDVKSKKTRWISPTDARSLVIGFTEDFDGSSPKEKRVKAIVDGENTIVDADKVDVVLKTSKQAFSISSNTIPFLPAIHGTRAQMATKMSEQAIPLVEREAPKVQVKFGTKTIEDALGTGFSVRASDDGVVKKVTKSAVVVQTKDGEVEYPIHKNVPLNNKAFVDFEPTVKAGDAVKAGQVVADSNFTREGNLALGTNLRAAYIPWKGYNFEDGIVVTESAAKKMTSEHLHKYVTTQDKTMELSRKKFLAWNPADITLAQMESIDDDGVVKKGTILKKGDPIMVGVKENRLDTDYLVMRRLGASNIKPVKGFMHEWSNDVPGEVVDVIRAGKSVKVFVRTKEPLQVGDKLTSRHGAKGIVTKVIPDGEAPHTADGEPVDILLNPHGIITRINPSQMLETAAAKVADKTGKPFIVDNFSSEDYAATVSNALKKAGIKDKEVLFDPHSKQPLGEVLVGPQYIYKLSKQATSQFSARSEGKYDINRQPLRGGEDGAKSLDMLTFYSLLSHGARANLREMATYKGTQNQEFWDWLSGGEQTSVLKPPPEPTFAYRKFESYMKGAGVNMQRRGSKMIISPLTDREITNMSSGEIKEPVFLKAKNLEEERQGLMDPLVFGGRLGDRWGHYELAEPIANPAFEDAIKKLTGLKTAQFDSIVAGRAYVDPQTGELAEQGVTGGEGIKAMLSKVDVDTQLKELSDMARKTSSETKLDQLNKKIKILRGLKKANVRPEEAYVLSKIPILPPVFRPIVELEDGTLANPGLNTLYRDVGLVNNELKWQNDTPFITDDVKADLRRDLYNSVKAVTGVQNAKPVTYYPQARRPKGIVEQIKGTNQAKEGFFIGKVLRRQQNLVGRGTIIPDPKLGVDEVGLPEEMSWSIFEPFVMRRLINEANFTPQEASEELEGRTQTARAFLEREMSERPIMLNRAPSLHKFSIMAFKPRMVDGKAIKIPPLVVKGFNADFDGDTMTVHVPVLTDAVREAERLLPSNNLYNPGTGRMMLMPKNEASQGIYMMSKDPEESKKLMALLPPKLQAKWGGKVIGGKQLGDLLKDLATEMPIEHGKVLDKMKAMGDEYTYKKGFSVGIDDLLPNIPERDIITKKIDEAAKKVDFSKPEDKSKFFELVRQADSELEKVLNKRLDEQGNSFHMMVASGSRGNMTQLKQIVSAPMVVQDHKGNPQSVPVTKPFSKGLPFGDYWRTLYGARQSVVEGQLQTSEPGAFNKDIMASAITNVIAKDDCGAKKGVFLSVKDRRGNLNYHDLEDRFLAKDVRLDGQLIASAGSQVSSALIDKLRDKKVAGLEVRSPTTCLLPEGTCAKCYGIDEFGQLPSVGDNIGAKAGQSLCLNKGTLVMMADGSSRAIENLCPGDWVMGSDRRGILRPVQVAKLYSNGRKRVYRTSFRLGTGKSHSVLSVESTLDHKILSVTVPHHSDDRRPKPTVSNMKNPEAHQARFYAKLGCGYDGQIGKRAGVPRHALALGMILGDGCYTGGVTSNGISFSCHDPSLIADTAAYFESIGCRFVPQSTDGEYRITSLNRGKAIANAPLSTVRNPLRATLLELSMWGQYSHNKVMPDVSGWSNASVADLVAGMFATDGSVHVTRGGRVCLQYGSSSRLLVEQLRYVLMVRFGVYPSSISSYRKKRKEGGRHRPLYRIAINEWESVQRFAQEISIPGVKGPALKAAASAWVRGKRMPEAGRCRMISQSYIGQRETYDIEVDHEDHLFVLANGLIVSNSEPLTQMTLRSKHSGGISSAEDNVGISGYDKVDKLFKMHEIKKGKATLAEKSGVVEDVRDAPGGAGKIAIIGGKEHFIERDLWNSQKIRKGAEVKKGDAISDGLIQPKELVKLKGMLDAQNYVSSQVQEAYESQGIPVKRRNIETVMRAVGNTTKILDPGDSGFDFGDVAPWTVVNHFNAGKIGKVALDEALGKVLKEEVAGLPKNSVIDEKAKIMLERLGKREVEVGPKPIRHAPFLSGIQRLPMMRDDWMAQMGYRELANAIVQGAAGVKESDIHGYSPIPAFAYGAEFGDDPEGRSITEGVY